MKEVTLEQISHLLITRDEVMAGKINELKVLFEERFDRLEKRIDNIEEDISIIKDILIDRDSKLMTLQDIVLRKIGTAPRTLKFRSS